MFGVLFYESYHLGGTSCSGQKYRQRLPFETANQTQISCKAPFQSETVVVSHVPAIVYASAPITGGNLFAARPIVFLTKRHGNRCGSRNTRCWYFLKQPSKTRQSQSHAKAAGKNTPTCPPPVTLGRHLVLSRRRESLLDGLVDSCQTQSDRLQQ